MKIITSKTFDELLKKENLKLLDKISYSALKEIDDNNILFTDEIIETRYPAYVTVENRTRYLNIKFPTYKIRIISERYEHIRDELLKLFDPNEYSYYIQPDIVFIKQDGNKSVYLPEIVCLKDNLESNLELKKKICSFLAESKINYEYFPSHYIIKRNLDQLNIDYQNKYR